MADDTQTSITELKKAEARLRQSERTFRSLFEGMLDGCVYVDLEWRIQACNPAYARMLGYEVPEIIGKSALEFTPPRWHDWQENVVKSRFLSTGHTGLYEKEYIRKDGRTFPVECSTYVTRDESGEPSGAWAIVRDITQRQEAERWILESEARFRELFDEAPVCYHELDQQGRIVRVNATELSRLGYERSDMIGRPIWEFAAEPEQVRITTLAKLSGHQAPGRAIERTYRHKDGRLLTMLIDDRILADHNGRIHGIRSTMEDITERREAEAHQGRIEERVSRAERLESLSVIAAGIAHDFDNLLTVISGNAQYLREKSDIGEADKSLLRDMELAARHAAETTRALLHLSRPTTLDTQVLDINEPLAETCRLLKHTMPAEVRLEFEPAGEPCRVEADPGQLQQVFLNLLVNARDAVNGKGRIKAKTRILDSTAIPDDLFPLLSTSRFVCVSIEDNGCGMQESVLSRIFEPYFTTKPKDRGTGLGLPVVHRIVQSHRGQIDVHSTPGHGTRFDLFYPLAAETEAAPTGSAPAHSTPCTGHILIVDDEPMVGTLMRTVLESRGYRTRLAHEPAEGIAAVRTATRPFDLAIVDYAMPDMTGDRCLKEMRRHDPRLRAIMVTGHGNGEEGVRSAQCEVVYKPFDINKLLEVIARLMPTEA